MQNTANFPSQCDRRALNPLFHNASRNVPRTKTRTAVSNCARQRCSATPDSNLPETASNLPKHWSSKEERSWGGTSNEPQAAARSRWRAGCPRSCWCSPRRARRRRAPPWRPAAPPSQPSSPSSSPSHSARPPQTAEDNERHLRVTTVAMAPRPAVTAARPHTAAALLHTLTPPPQLRGPCRTAMAPRAAIATSLHHCRRCSARTPRQPRLRAAPPRPLASRLYLDCERDGKGERIWGEGEGREGERGDEE